MSTLRLFNAQDTTYTLNDVPYSDSNLYGDPFSGVLFSGSGNQYNPRTGLTVTVSIPPTLMAFKYPNLVAGQGSPYVSNDDRETLSNRGLWYAAANAYSTTQLTKSKTIIRRQINRAKTELQTYKARGDKQGMARAQKEIDRLNAKLAEIDQNLRFSPKLLNQYSTEFEISQFIKTISWSSSRENSFIELSIQLDNIRGLFNYLPEGAKVTVWRRKSISGTSGRYRGKWYRYITCYISRKEKSLEARSNSMSLTCWDRAAFLESQISKRKKWLKDKKNHKNGWTPREITLDICKRENIPVNTKKIPTHIVYKKRIKKTNGQFEETLVRKVLPRISYDPESLKLATLLTGAWKQSIQKLPIKEQLPFVMHMRNGVLEVEFVAAPGEPLTQVDAEGERLLAKFTDQNIESSSTTEDSDPEQVYTVLNASGSYKYVDAKTKNKKGKPIVKVKKIKGTFYPSGNRGKFILNVYGRLERQHAFKQVFQSADEFRKHAQGVIDRNSRPKRSLEITARAPLGIWPINYVHIASRELGVRANLMVESVSYSVENGTIRASLSLNSSFTHYSSGAKYYSYPESETDRWY